LRKAQGKSCVAAKGVKHVNVEENVPTAVGSEVSGKEEDHFRYTSRSYQRILDYHVTEILLTTIIFGVILLLRLHH
jgi:uncharacterized membrane protein